MIEETIFYSRLKQEIKKSRKSTNQIERELGYSRNSLHNYKNGTEPSGTRLIEIAEYFHVSPKFLIGKTDISSENSPIILFDQLDDVQKFEMLKLCHNWSENMIKKAQLPNK
ncbi:helix-turn-helix domain-containing protein [Lactococcus lactis]|uniref:Helix-turn-helix domain-containing protein n=1 Tax=Lactococcus lactis TaxID=1358 RepID=A0A9X4S520_9LACT|nr:helix-turn-helix transcriptional regulator [Lactococcus lactis]MDG4983872.1 helix-turn-helix domain-containing protein [Lactococcus lactis]